MVSGDMLENGVSISSVLESVKPYIDDSLGDGWRRVSETIVC